jgi:cation:H+ antiporter
MDLTIALQIVGGLILLALGGEGVVRGAVGVARKLGVSELMIGLTLVGFGTSTPELLTSINAAFNDAPGIAIGNVVGSNIGNILLIFALVIMIKPISVDPKAIQRDSMVMIGVSVLMIALALIFNQLNFSVGVIFVAGLIAYIVSAYMAERTAPAGGADAASAAMHEGEGHSHDPSPDSLLLSLLFAIGGLALLIFGADILVKGAIALATIMGMSQTVIGLTIVAVGTSLPELVASLAAAWKGRSDVAIGNIIGSNIYNILGILGITALIKTVPVPADMVWRDWIAMLGAAVILVLMAQTKTFSRAFGAILFALYVGYTYLLVTGFGNPPAIAP